MHPRGIRDFFDALVAMQFLDREGEGPSGLLCIEAARQHPHIHCTSFDLPAVEPIAQKHIASAGLSDRIRTASGDFSRDPLPKADIITMGMILHDWNRERKMHVIRSAYDVRRENVFGLNFL